MIESGKYPAKFKYLYMAQWVVIATIFWLTFRFIAQFEFTIWEAMILFADVALIMSLVYVIPLQRKDKAHDYHIINIITQFIGSHNTGGLS